MSVSRRTFAAGAAALLLLCAAVFGRTLGHDFVSLDDTAYVVENPRVSGGLSAGNLRWAFGSFHVANWHPLTWLSHQLDAELFGLRPAGHHATSVLLHGATSVLLFLVFAALTGSAGVGFLIGALFAVHPLHVESVAWVAERKDVLSGLFFALTLLLWLRYLRRPSRSGFAAALAAHGAGLLAKPMLVTTPLVLLLLDWWPLGRHRAPPEAADGGEPPPRTRLLLEKLPFLALSAASAVVTFVAQERGHAMAGTEALPPPLRLGNAAVALVRYLERTVWPSGLAAFYPHPGSSLSATLALACGAAIAVATVAAFLLRRRAPWLAAGWAWFLVMLLPVLGLVQVGPQAMADRYTYLPLLGVFLIAALGGRAALRRLGAPRPASPALAGGIIAALAAAAFVQAGVWRDSFTLYERALAVTGENWLAKANLAHEHLRYEGPERAVALYRGVALQRPNLPGIQFGLALALERAGDAAGAREAYTRALALQPDHAEAHNNLGLLLGREGRDAEAEAHLRRAVEIKPDFAEALVNLGLFLGGRGSPAEALALLERAVAAAPGNADAHFNLAVALARAGRPADAEAAYRRAVEIRPGFAAARNNLGTLLLRSGRPVEAAEQLRAAVAAAPDDAEIRSNLQLAERMSRGERPRPPPD